MDFLFIAIIGLLISIFELAFINVASPKKFELKIIDNTPTAIVYTNYFFLPFTTKIRKYKNLQKAYIKKKVEKRKKSICIVYDLILEFPKKTIILFENKFTEEDLLKHCEKINQSIASFEECVINESIAISKKNAIILLLFCTPLLIFIPQKHSKNGYITDITQNFYIYLVATGIVIIFIVLSLIVNLFMDTIKNKSSILVIDYNKEENIDIDSEAKRINDSLIK